MVILHERELTWAGRVTWKHHTCMVSALSISTTLKQHPLIWSAVVRRLEFLLNITIFHYFLMSYYSLFEELNHLKMLFEFE